jgi:cytochrome c
MNKMYIAVLVVTPLLAGLLGCQREQAAQRAESSPPQSVTPVATRVPAADPVAAKPAAKAGGALSEAEARALAQKSGCFACHMIDKKLTGPGWKDVAAKYRGQKGAEDKLIAKVAKGGAGVWGPTPMPPNAPRVNENDIKALVHFILGLK